MELGREQILEALGRIALSNPNDAVTLAMEGKDCYVKDLDLWGVSELKVAGNGGMEIKFFDRIKALEKLWEFSQTESSEPLSFYRALEESAGNAAAALREEYGE